MTPRQPWFWFSARFGRLWIRRDGVFWRVTVESANGKYSRPEWVQVRTGIPMHRAVVRS